MTENSNPSCSASGQAKCAPVGLLLFVGFIFGFSVGFGTHDIVYGTLSKAMYGGQSAVSAPIDKGEGRTSDEATSGEEGVDDAPVEEAKPEEAKPEEKVE